MAEVTETSTDSMVVQIVETESLTGDLSSEETDLLQVSSADNVGQVSSRIKNAKSNINVVIAGKPSSGKSTAFNNLFDLDLDAGISAMSHTSQVIRRSARKNGITINVFDTPGLEAEDIDTKTVLNQLAEEIKGLDYILLYCLSVSSCSSVNKLDNAIVTALHNALGKEVWGKCVILFTFSDHARLEKTEDGEYIKYLQQCAEAFNLVLSKCGAEVQRVITVFDYPKNQRKEAEVVEGIVAVPTCKRLNCQEDILPGIVSDEDNWTDIVFDEILKKVNKKQRESYLKAKYGIAVLGSTAAATIAGATVGAGIGTLVGIAGGPIGMIVGAFVGGAAGGGVSLLTSLPLSVIIALRKWKKKHSKNQIRK